MVLRLPIVCLLCLLVPSVWASEQASEVFATASPAVFSLGVMATDNSARIGSGVLVAPGKIATNYHVVANARTIYIKQGDNTVEGVLEIGDAKHDVAIVSAPALTGRPITLNAATPLVGQNAYAIGSPRGLDLSLSAGIVSSLRPVPDGSLIQTTAAISQGSSGGGLFDAQGRLIGLTTAQVIDGQNLNFAIPVRWLEYVGIPVDGAAPEVPAAVIPAPASAVPMAEAVQEPAPPVTAEQVKSAVPVKAEGSGYGLMFATISVIALLVLAKPATNWLMNWMSSDTLPSPSRAAIRAATKTAPPDQLAPFRVLAEQELADKTPEAKIWAQALQQTALDENRARHAYIHLRAYALHKAELDRRWNAAAAENQGVIRRSST